MGQLNLESLQGLWSMGAAESERGYVTVKT